MHTNAGRLPVQKLSELCLLAHLEHLEFTLEVPFSSPNHVSVFMRSSKHASVRLRYCSTGFTNLKEENQPEKRDSTFRRLKSEFYTLC